MNDDVFAVTPADEGLYSVLAEAGFPSDLINPRHHRSYELVDQYVLHLAIELVERLELPSLLTAPRTVEELLARSGFVSAFRPGLRWLLERLSAAGNVTREEDGSEVRYALYGALPHVAPSILRATVLDGDPAYAPTFALLDEAAAAYPRVALGKTSGEQALLQKVALWCAYFSNDNPYYAVSNRIAAHVASTRLPPEDAAVLELGAGLGSATQALLERLREAGRIAALASYQVTEPVPFFRRRAQRTLSDTWPDIRLRFGPLDLNAPWNAQGVPAETVNLVWAVNVFHLARDLEATLREALTVLVPGGWLILGEGIRPFLGHVVDAEFPFQLLRAFVDVETDHERRPTHGFLTPEQWVGALLRVGFSRVELIPDLFRIRDVFPRFVAGVVCGRRPSV